MTDGRERRGEGGVGYGTGPSEERSGRPNPTGQRTDAQTKRPMESKHETFYVVLHQTTGDVGPHKQPVGLPAFLLLTAHWSYHELTYSRKEKINKKCKNNMKQVGYNRALW